MLTFYLIFTFPEQIPYDDLMMTIMGGPILSFIWNVLQVLGIISGVKLMCEILRRLLRTLCRDFPETDQDRMEQGFGLGYRAQNGRNLDRENWMNSIEEDRGGNN